MTAYVASLNTLRENVRSQVRHCRTLTDVLPGALVYEQRVKASQILAEGLDLLLEQLDADCREVRADVEQLIEGGEF